MIFTFGGLAPSKLLKDEVAGAAKGICESSPFKFNHTLEVSGHDFGLYAPATAACFCWFCQDGDQLDIATSCFKSLSMKFADAAAASNVTLRDFIFSSKDAAARRPATAPDEAESAGSDSEPGPKKRKGLDLTAVIAKSKALRLLPSSFELPEETPKPVLKVMPSNPKPNFVATCYMLLEKAKHQQSKSIVAASLAAFPKAPGDLAVNEVPLKGLRDGRLLLCSGGGKPRLRVTLPEETLMMKLWPPCMFNVSMVSSKVKAQSVSDCPMMPAVYALLLSASAALHKSV